MREHLRSRSHRGAFSRGVNGSNINNLLNKYHSSVAGRIGPAGQALIQAGLFTSPQLTSLGAVLTSVALAPVDQVSNDSLINTDIRVSKVFRIKERLTIEPMVEAFNLFNIANYDPLSSSLSGNVGDPNGTGKGQYPTRIGSGSGSFAPGVQRAYIDRKSTRLNSSHLGISYAVFCLKKKKIASMGYI